MGPCWLTAGCKTRIGRHKDLISTGGHDDKVVLPARGGFAPPLVNKTPHLISPRNARVVYRPPDVQLGIVPDIGELPSWIVIAALFIMKYGFLA